MTQPQPSPLPSASAAAPGPLSAAEKHIVAALSASHLFAGVAAPELIALLAYCRIERAAAGAEIFQDGDPGANLYVITEGHVEIRVETISPHIHVTLATLEAGDTFGELSYADERPRSGAARCRKDCEFIVLNGYKLKEHWERHPEAGLIFHRNMTRLLAERLRKMNHKILSAVRQRHFSK